MPPIPPLVVAGPPGFQAIIDLRGMDLDQDPAGILRPAALANSIAVFLDARTAKHGRLEVWADYLLSVTPHTCWRIVYPGNEEWPAARWRRLRRLFLYPDHYVNRSRSLCRDLQGAFSVRLFQAIDDVPSARRFLGAAREADLVLRPRPGKTDDWEEICRETPWLFVDPQAPETERSRLAA